MSGITSAQPFQYSNFYSEIDAPPPLMNENTGEIIGDRWEDVIPQLSPIPSSSSTSSTAPQVRRSARLSGDTASSSSTSATSSPPVRKSTRKASYRAKRAIQEISDSYPEEPSPSPKLRRCTANHAGFQAFNARFKQMRELFSNTVDAEAPGIINNADYQRKLVNLSKKGPLCELTEIRKVRHTVRRKNGNINLNKNMLILSINQNFLKALYKNNSPGTARLTESGMPSGAGFKFEDVLIVETNKYWCPANPFSFYYPDYKSQSFSSSPEKTYYHSMPKSFFSSKRIKQLRKEGNYQEITQIICKIYERTQKIFNARFEKVGPDGKSSMRSISSFECSQLREYMLEDRKQAIREILYSSDPVTSTPPAPRRSSRRN